MSALNSISATVPISVVNGFLSGADRAAVVRLAGRSGIPHELLKKPAARVTQEQFSTLYRLLAMELDDEMPGIFSRPLRNGLLKFLCLSLLDAPRLEVALHRFGQFFHLILDDFRLVSWREGELAYVEFVANPDGPPVSALARELVLKLVHGVGSWLIRQKIPLVEVTFEFLRPAQSGDLLYLFPGPVRFGRDKSCLVFDAAYLDRPIRQRKSDLQDFLRRAPEDWIFVSFAEQMVCHHVRQCIVDSLPKTPTVDVVAQQLHYSVRTLCRRLEAEGTTFQAIKDEVRRDVAIQRLTRSDDAIAAIAYDVGFDNPTAFHRAFRHWTGSTPAAYRDTK
ncbi:transcriptional regulator, AraC family [Burkholderia sp. lig30]|jgi:AraC-like DNA-binding protein|uniref:AraC family transcriptional regulator n=1 Tax=Burkholderia sp. lig30 TaxID=1192124 RepID=UPI000461F435|nr:AraC family transcriptional regulator [Burkholderia sp. lig30]KDB08210.1 transcriptional regulator, AraC family [Burkholderia sp. lig30]